MEEGGGGSSRAKRARKMPKKYEMEEESTEEQNKRLRKEQKRREKEETTTKAAASPADDMKSKTFVEKLNHMLDGSAGKYDRIIEWSTDGRLIVLVDVSPVPAACYCYETIRCAD